MATKQNAKEYPIQIIRENLRQRSTQEAALLARSVGRLTSCDVQPCLEYSQEIANEHAVIDLPAVAHGGTDGGQHGAGRAPMAAEQHPGLDVRRRGRDD